MYFYNWLAESVAKAVALQLNLSIILCINLCRTPVEYTVLNMCTTLSAWDNTLSATLSQNTRGAKWQHHPPGQEPAVTQRRWSVSMQDTLM